MTANEMEVLAFVARFIRERGYSPTLGEIADGCGLPSISTAKRVSDSLIAQGHLRHEPGIGRTIRLVETK